jgi:hypothetical protein
LYSAFSPMVRESQFGSSGHPLNDAAMWDSFLAKEKEFLASRPKQIAAAERSFVIPAPGEAVELIGMRKRPNMNGAKGEIVGGVDEEGFITVRLQAEDAQRAAISAGRKQRSTMKVRPKCLQPLTSASSPDLLAPYTAVSQWDGQSMRTGSSSVASRSTRASRSNRSLGSGAVGAAARESLSGAGSVASLKGVRDEVYTPSRYVKVNPPSTHVSTISSRYHKQHLQGGNIVNPVPSWIIGKTFGEDPTGAEGTRDAGKKISTFA